MTPTLPRNGVSGHAGAVHKGLRPGDYVFGTVDEQGISVPYRHGNFGSRVFSPACKHLGLAGVQFKSVRHYYASVLIDEGVNVREVAARLGHHDPAFTLRTYVHLFAKPDAGLGDRIAARRSNARGDKRNVVALRLVGS
jgi:integrase